MTVTDYLSFMGKIRGMNQKWINERINKVIDHVRLGDYRNTHVGKLSKVTDNELELLKLYFMNLTF